MRDARDDKARITWIGFALQAVWRTGTMISRMVALLLCASVIHAWFLLAISIHWLVMTCWTIKQKTDLCTTQWEERVYNAIVGGKNITTIFLSHIKVVINVIWIFAVIYCFCFFNLKVILIRCFIVKQHCTIKLNSFNCIQEGQSRHRAVVFYTITATENAACLAVFLQFSDGHIYDKELHTAAPIIIVFGSLIGMFKINS